MVCWVPFHFVFDVSLANPYIIPEDLYTAAFWMTYVNSGLNNNYNSNSYYYYYYNYYGL